VGGKRTASVESGDSGSPGHFSALGALLAPPHPGSPVSRAGPGAHSSVGPPRATSSPDPSRGDRPSSARASATHRAGGRCSVRRRGACELCAGTPGAIRTRDRSQRSPGRRLRKSLRHRREGGGEGRAGRGVLEAAARREPRRGKGARREREAGPGKPGSGRAGDPWGCDSGRGGARRGGGPG
jgi:hypothetical protein